MNSVYYHEREDGMEVLRFYPNGIVIKVATTGKATAMEKILTWFNLNGKEGDRMQGKYTRRGLYISFELLRGKDALVCTGSFDSDEFLNLFTHSHINGHKSDKLYQLYKSPNK